jgi:hypothetical protein
LKLAIFAQTMGMARPFKTSITVQNMLPCTFLQANLGKMANRVLLQQAGQAAVLGRLVLQVLFLCYS